jgi:hypothetical protein
MKLSFRIRLLAVLLVLAAAALPAWSQDEGTTIVKDSVQVTAFTLNVYHKNFDTWSWIPQMTYRVNGPIASGSQLYVDFTVPGTGAWVKFDCKTSNIEKGRSWKTECGGRDIPEDKGITYVGAVKFTIHMRNELQGSDVALFSGTAKVAKAHSNEGGPKVANHWVYYVDQDWNLPIAYAFYLPDEVKGMKYPSLGFALWTRGEYSPMDPHLFHDGKEVGKLYFKGEEVGKPGCAHAEVEDNTTHITAPTEPKFIWTRSRCDFPSIKGWNNTGDKNNGTFGPLYIMSENPGDYELKILKKGHLIRSMKFSVDATGKIVDNGIATANKMGTNRIIEPIQILGDEDGPWSRTAWKTDAFYGNPLTGFTAVK